MIVQLPLCWGLGPLGPRQESVTGGDGASGIGSGGGDADLADGASGVESGGADAQSGDLPCITAGVPLPVVACR